MLDRVGVDLFPARVDAVSPGGRTKPLEPNETAGETLTMKPGFSGYGYADGRGPGLVDAEIEVRGKVPLRRIEHVGKDRILVKGVL
jgi:hypothetical protein